MAIRTRILEAGDVASLLHVARGVFDDPLNPQATAEFLADPRHHLVVAMDETKVVGFISAVHYVHPDKPKPELWINEVSVAATHREQGIARAMMNTVLDLAHDLGCADAWVLTDSTNRIAQHLYESAGGVAHDDKVIMYTFTPTLRRAVSNL